MHKRGVRLHSDGEVLAHREIATEEDLEHECEGKGQASEGEGADLYEAVLQPRWACLPHAA